MVEQILESAASRAPAPTPVRDGSPRVEHALWICACDSDDDDAPTWLIYDTGDDRIGWCRVPEGTEPLDLVDARLSAGDHTGPSEVLAWLEGTVPAPWPDDGGREERTVIEQLTRRIRRDE